MRRSSAISVKGDLLRVGLFVVSGIVILAMLAVQLSGAQFTDKRVYRAAFTDVAGLEEGDEVRVAGVRVGEVDEINLVDNKPHVAFSVERGIEVTDDVHVVVRYKNLLGDRFLELSKNGDSSAPIDPGTVIPVSKTAPALDLDALLNGFQPLFEGLDAGQVNELAQNLITVLQGQGGTVESLLDHIGRLTNGLADRDQVIGRLVTNMGDVLTTLDKRGGQLSGTLTRLQKVVSGLAKDRKVLGESLDELGTMADSFTDLLVSSRKPLKRSVAELGRLTKQLDKDKDELEFNITELVDFYVRASRIGAYGSFTNAYLCGLQVKFTGPDGKTMYTPWIDSNTSSERCRKEAP